MSKWENRFINIAKEISSWSKDPSTKIGAVIIRDKKIISTGYNGFPQNIEDSEERLNNREEKYKYVIHAELNAILNAAKFGVSLQDSSIFVYGLPTCSSCAKAIIQSGIKEVHYKLHSELPDKWKKEFEISKNMYDEAGVNCIEHNANLENDAVMKIIDGTKRCYLNGVRHRVDGPAVEYANGTKHWYQNGELHRVDGPAIEYPDGTKYWYLNGKRHWVDGPAAEYSDGSKYWYQNDEIHRVDGPAIEHPNGTKHWYQNDKLHRVDGPAVEYSDGTKFWYQNGVRHRVDK